MANQRDTAGRLLGFFEQSFQASDRPGQEQALDFARHDLSAVRIF
jgi:hypothetical protein